MLAPMPGNAVNCIGTFVDRTGVGVVVHRIVVGYTAAAAAAAVGKLRSVRTDCPSGWKPQAR